MTGLTRMAVALVAAGLAVAVAVSVVAKEPTAASMPATSPAGSPAASQPTQEQIAALVADLDVPDLKQNMLAYDQLMTIGLPAVGPLRELGRRTRCQSTQIRVAMMVPEIVRQSKEKPAPPTVDEKKYPWTAPVVGIAMRLSADREKCNPGELVRLRVDFRNVDKVARPFAPLTRLQLPTASGGQVEAELRLNEPYPAKARDYKAHPLEMQLQPGEVVTYRFRINQNLSPQLKVMLMHDQMNHQRAGLPLAEVSTIDLRLPEGEATVRFNYFAASRGLLEGAQGNLSASVTLNAGAD